MKDEKLIKALRCLASQTRDGACYMDAYNRARENQKKCMYCEHERQKRPGFESIQCPFYQGWYGTSFEDEECSEWLHHAADILEEVYTREEKR